MSLSLIPLCGAFPMDRLLIFARVGAFALTAQLVEEVVFWAPQPADDGPNSGATGDGLGTGAAGNGFVTSAAGDRLCISTAGDGLGVGAARDGLGPRAMALTIILMLLHVGVAVPAYLVRASCMPLLQGMFAAGARSAPIDETGPGQTFITINGNDFPNTYTAVIRKLDGKLPAPRRMAMLATLTHQLTVHRDDVDTLVFTTEGGYLSETVEVPPVMLMPVLSVPGEDPQGWRRLWKLMPVLLEPGNDS